MTIRCIRYLGALFFVHFFQGSVLSAALFSWEAGAWLLYDYYFTISTHKCQVPLVTIEK
ncbi:hypothetical protein [Nostoc sp. 'Peltigera membranacea cyanobiont' 213]|uniref:hypothetical protein n=1 Tax=Nostoc sp. 'Peltigera membranacea cyanobiont' 213 TaxID=2014530 RepID=UPI001CB92303|nr:hypothetical protein [Nostoc sp. 'Peltigera membranacea cyanobiont' 213]